MNRSTRTSLLAALATAATVLSLRPLLQGSGWLVNALLVVGAVAGAGILVHRLTRRHGAAVLAQVVVWAAALLLLYAPGTTVLGIVPTQETVSRLTRLAVDGASVIQRHSVPVADLRGLQLLIVGAVGLVALTVDLLASRLQHPALAGIPLLATYAVPVALAPGGAGAVGFAVAALCYLLLLRSDVSGRERRWVPASARRGSAGLGLAAAAVALAVLVPAAVPKLDERPLTLDMGPGEAITVINPIINLKQSLGARSDAVVLVYETTEDSPAPLRIVTADVFDGETWAPRTGTDIPRSQRVQDGLPIAPGLSEDARSRAPVETTSIRVRRLDQTYLPLPYPAERVDIEGEWLFEQGTLNVVGDGETTRDRSYVVRHLDVTPEERLLRSAPPAPAELREEYTALPESLPASVREMAAEVTRDAVDDYERATMLQRFFRTTGGFTYSTDAPNDGGSDAVAAFLRERSGFCVQFASAMAVMARSLGIPARVAIGFLPGDRAGEGRWRISAQDAHAWPELYFEGTGWVRFEPTPGSRTSAAPPWSQPSVVPAPGVPGATTPLAPQAAPNAGAQPSAPTPTESADPTTPGDGLPGAAPDGRAPWAVVVLVLLALTALLVPVVSNAVLVRRRWRAVRDAGDAAEAAWVELGERTRDLGFTWAPSATPRQAAERLGEFAELPAAEAARLTRLREAVERSRFAPGAADGGEHPARSDVDRIVAVVAGQQPRAVRWRARLWPSAGWRSLSGRWGGPRPTAADGASREERVRVLR